MKPRRIPHVLEETHRQILGGIEGAVRVRHCLEDLDHPLPSRAEKDGDVTR